MWGGIHWTLRIWGPTPERGSHTDLRLKLLKLLLSLRACLFSLAICALCKSRSACGPNHGCERGPRGGPASPGMPATAVKPTLEETVPEGGGVGESRREASGLPLPSLTFTRELLRSFPHSKQVGSYLVGKMINKGSFAKVMEGLHIGTGEKVGAFLLVWKSHTLAGWHPV